VAGRWAQGSDRSGRLHPLLLPGAALALIQAAGLLVTPDLGDGLRQVCILPSYAIIAAAAPASRQGRTLSRLYALAGALVAIHALLQYAGRFMGADWGAFQTLGGLPRPRAAFVEADWLGLYLMSVLPFFLSLLIEARCPAETVTAVAGMGPVLAALALSQCRAAGLTLIPMLVLYGALTRQVPGATRAWAGILLTASCLGGGCLLWGPRYLGALGDRLQSTADRKESSARWRLETLEAMAAHIARSPWTGEGPGSVKALLGDEIPALTQSRGGSAGGLYTTVAFESGLPGLAALLWAMATVWKEAIRRWRQAAIPTRAGPAAVLTSLAGLFLTGLLFDVRYLMPFWLLLGQATAGEEDRKGKEILVRF